MASGYFIDDQVTTPLLHVVQNQGTFPSRDGTGGATEDYVGAIRTFAFSYIPGGYQTNGAMVSVNRETLLYFVEGTSFGGNGSSTFNVPNLSGTVAVGVDNQTVGERSGKDVVAVGASQFPASLGGSSAPIGIGQPSLTVQYLICTSGELPSASRSANGIFLGEIVAFTGNFVPTGFTPADGRSLLAANNVALFSVLGRTYTSSSDFNTFNLPDLRARDIVGAGTIANGPSIGLGQAVGRSSVSLARENLPAANGGGGQPFSDQQPGLGLNYIINVSAGVYPVRSDSGAALQPDSYLGEVRAFAGQTGFIPQGWVLANGQSLPLTSNYYAIYSLLGTTYGGDGVTNFRVPNLVGKSVVGTGTRNGVTYSEGIDYGTSTATLVVTDATPCFCLGTAILTPGGEVPVESIRPGDSVVTAAGAVRRVRWVGHRSRAGRFLRANPDGWPVRFVAGSLGGGLPRRDLLVSANHAMLLDGVLVPAGALVNGATVVRERGLERVDYFHVELDSHDVLLAEGAPSESFVDDGSRGMFHNAASYRSLYPDAVAAPVLYCAPRVEDGAALEAIRERLAAVASLGDRAARAA